MKVYFLSSEPCALTLNDIYYGITDKFERFIEVSLTDNIYARFSPQGKQSIGFFINEHLRFCPPDGCNVYLFKDGIAIYAWDFLFSDPTMQIIAQERHKDTLYTLFVQGRVQLSIQTQENFFISYLPPSFLNSILHFYNDLCLLEGQNTLAIYTKMGKCLLQERFIDYHVENNQLNATLPLLDSQNRVLDCVWNLDKDTCTRAQFTIRFLKEKNDPSVPTSLLAYSFFESLLLGADCSQMLSDELKNRLPDIQAFLGEYHEVLLTDDETVCGLVIKKAERLFDVRYVGVDIKNGKIIDVKG